MKKFTLFACVALTLMLAAGSAMADYRPQAAMLGDTTVLIGGGQSFAKAEGDTINLLGRGGTFQGDFENVTSKTKYTTLPPDWTSADESQKTESKWNVSQTNNDRTAVVGSWSAWCGDFIESCSVGVDDPWGYGNNWMEWLQFVYDVPSPTIGTTVNLTYNIFYDNEPDYDYIWLKKVAGNADPLIIKTYNGLDDLVGETATMSFSSQEYTDGNLIVRWEFFSDGGWSDEDCSWPTSGAGNLDELYISCDDGSVLYESTATFEDETFGDWATEFPPGCGNYTAIWDNLDDIDPCASNPTKCVAFVDDGTVTGEDPYPCDTWCYGPDGYVVHPEGGLAGPLYHMVNCIISPEMPWPDQTYDGIWFHRTVYGHETFDSTSPGMMLYWGIRSATDAQDIWTQPWLDRNYVYYTGQGIWYNTGDTVSDLMVNGRTSVQVKAGVNESGYIWGYAGTDATPAPYYDNFRVAVFPVIGPGISARTIEVANDNFYEAGSFNSTVLATNNVRFDMPMLAVGATTDEWIDHGDSMVVNIVPLRPGATLVGMPELHWTLQKNPLFPDGIRTAFGGATSGVVLGSYVVINGIPNLEKFAFDLPDSQFLYPGDLLHYYIKATDIADGVPQEATMPADRTGYGDFSHPLNYSGYFNIHCLPSISDLAGSQPPILFWCDVANGFGYVEWIKALDNSGMVLGRDYDMYFTNGPSSGVGNGLGAMVDEVGLDGYTDMLYTAGGYSSYTLCNGDFQNDPSPDILVMMAWLDYGGKDLFMTGDGICTDLMHPDNLDGNNFVDTYMGVNFFDRDVRDNIGNQATPRVRFTQTTVVQNVETFMAYGGCPTINEFDATGVTSGVAQARFLKTDGTTYNAYSAFTLNVLGSGSRVCSMPLDFMYIWDDLKINPAPLTARAQILQDVLGYFGHDPNTGDVSAVPDVRKFETSNYPNPFNPVTTIKYYTAVGGEMTMKVYNLEGALVRTLINGHVEAGEGTVIWDGTSDSGSTVSSGMYFYETAIGDNVEVNKMMLVK